MKLMIVESPNKTKKIKAILGEGWDVAASVGHFRDLPRKELGVGADFALTYEYTERGKATIDALKPRVARAEMVYIATDPDREGEAIAWHLVEVLKLKKYHRVTFDAITESVIRKVLDSPRQLDMISFAPRQPAAPRTVCSAGKYLRCFHVRPASQASAPDAFKA